MHLKLLLPSETLIDADVGRIIAEAENGSFCLLPRHVDFVTALVPGLFHYVTPAGEEHFLAVAEGSLVKCGAEVLVSVLDAVPGDRLETLHEVVEQRFKHLSEQEKTARSALSRLEASVIRRFVEIR
jgi:F-type H+-transporting ATPase subunit epsilon